MRAPIWPRLRAKRKEIWNTAKEISYIIILPVGKVLGR